MVNGETEQFCLKFLQELREKGKSYSQFEKNVSTLQEQAAMRGLKDPIIRVLSDVIVHADLGATKLVSLIKCLIPQYKMHEEAVKCMITWCLSSLNELPVTVSTIMIQWIVGLWDYQLVDKNVVNIYYDVLFYAMLKKERLERHIARLIYVLTKPEDVTRTGVTRLLTLHQKYSKPQKHIIVLLSLFKSYKPELVPEKVQTMNVENVWKPIPEVLRLYLRDARDRAELQHIQNAHSECFNWNTFQIVKTIKTGSPLLPSVGYFQIGSSIFKEKDAKSVFDIYSMEELGKIHQSIELPCHAISLLSNVAGYHLLTYSDFQYQSRFSYNLYNTLIRAFILENGKFSAEEMNTILDMTTEFSRYMQQGIPVVNLFFDEYLYFNTGQHQSKLLALLQWMISVSITEFKEKVLVHIQNIFFESTLDTKCEIIKSFRILITNLFVNQGFDECRQNTPAAFLGQGPIDNLEDVIPVLTKMCENLIVSGLSIHYYNVLLLSEALSFYEEISILEQRSSMLLLTLAPAAVVYGGFVTKACAVLSRVCRLLLRYREMSLQFRGRKVRDLFKNKIYTIDVYAQDIVTALWYNEPFSKRNNAYFLKNIPKKVMEDLDHCGLDYLLNISNHFAVLPYKWTLSKTGLNISTKEDAARMAMHYYPAVREFLAIFVPYLIQL